jgi:hypothetical protein
MLWLIWIIMMLVIPTIVGISVWLQQRREP